MDRYLPILDADRHFATDDIMTIADDFNPSMRLAFSSHREFQMSLADSNRTLHGVLHQRAQLFGDRSAYTYEAPEGDQHD